MTPQLPHRALVAAALAALAGCSDPAEGGEPATEGGFTSGDSGGVANPSSSSSSSSSAGTDGADTSSGESGADTTDGPSTESEGSSTGPTPVRTFETDVQPLLMERCFGAVCHNGDPIGSPTVSFVPENDPYTTLTEDAHAFSGMPYVTAGDPDQSYIFRKLLGTHDEDDLAGLGQGVRMPLTNGPLSDDELSTVRGWIDDGALP